MTTRQVRQDVAAAESPLRGATNDCMDDHLHLAEQLLDCAMHDRTLPHERRLHPRAVMDHQPVVAIPVDDDGSPMWEDRISGTLLDASLTGLGLELHATDSMLRRHCVVGITTAADRLEFVGVEVRHRTKSDEHALRVGCQVGGPSDAIVQERNLKPAVRTDSLDIGYGVRPDVLQKWADLGVLQTANRDRVKVCPRCQGLPTFRSGCRQCSSAWTTNDRLIHHYACAHVGYVSEFETPAGIVCPKCRTRNLVVGADYEYMLGPHRCQECNWQDSELEEIGQCLRCGIRFPSHMAHEQEMNSYRAARLDTLALVAPR